MMCYYLNVHFQDQRVNRHEKYYTDPSTGRREIAERVGLYLYSTHTPSWHEKGIPRTKPCITIRNATCQWISPLNRKPTTHGRPVTSHYTNKLSSTTSAATSPPPPKSTTVHQFWTIQSVSLHAILPQNSARLVCRY